MQNEKTASLFLRLSIAFAFLYPPIAALGSPDSWIGYFPPFLLDLFKGNELLLLNLFGAVEIIIALWILSGKKIFIPSAIAAAMLVGIVLFNLNNFEVVFRDLSIAGAALTLAVMNFPRSKE